jgi:hypothetical protein
MEHYDDRQLPSRCGRISSPNSFVRTIRDVPHLHTRERATDRCEQLIAATAPKRHAAALRLHNDLLSVQ